MVDNFRVIMHRDLLLLPQTNILQARLVFDKVTFKAIRWMTRCRGIWETETFLLSPSCEQLAQCLLWLPHLQTSKSKHLQKRRCCKEEVSIQVCRNQTCRWDENVNIAYSHWNRVCWCHSFLVRILKEHRNRCFF